MDFHSLSRKELQSLSKKNKIPANITNVAMADALAALPSVEGIEEILNVEDNSRVLESPKKEENVSLENPRTALRTSARRKVVKEDPKTLLTSTRTRRGIRQKTVEETDHENKDLNVAFTPALPSGRRRTAAASACKKVDFQINIENEDKEKNDVHATPVVLGSQKRFAMASASRKTETQNIETTEQRVTRRSVRLLEKNMESLSLKEDRKTEPIVVHLSFDEMPQSEGPGITDDSGSKPVKEQNLSTALNVVELEIDDQENDETKDEVEINPEISTSATKLFNGKSSDDEISKDMNDYEADVPESNLDVIVTSEDKGKEEASEDNNAPEVLAEDTNDAARFSLHLINGDEKTCELSTEDNFDFEEAEVMDNSAELSLPRVNVEEETEDEVSFGEDLEYEADIEDANFMNSSATKLSLPHEVVEEESEDEDSTAEPVRKVENEYETEIEQNFGDKEEALDADMDGNKKDLEMTVSVQGEEDVKMKLMEDKDDVIVDSSTIQTCRDLLHHEETCNNEKPTADMADFISEDLVDVKIQVLMDKIPEDVNDALDSPPEIDNRKCETLLEVPITPIEELPISFGGSSVAPFAPDQLAGQFPRPSIKEQTRNLRINVSDAEEEDEEEGIQEQTAEIKDLSLVQLRKLLKEKLQLSKKNINDNSKVVGGKVRTALQQLPENRMDIHE